jgi:hypothetical protein
VTRTLAFAWIMYRVARSVRLALGALTLLVGLCVAISLERQAVEREAESAAQAAQLVATNPPADDNRAQVVAWRQQLLRQASALPPRNEVSGIVRNATGILEASGISIESVNTNYAAPSSTTYQALTLEARMTGDVVRAASAMSNILASSPGWSIERLSIERQTESVASIEAMLVLLYGGAK